MVKESDVDQTGCDCDSPLGHPCPHDPWGADSGGAVLWLSIGLVVIGVGLWWAFR